MPLVSSSTARSVAQAALLPLTNVLVFAVVQTLFFWFVGSKEVLTVVSHKARILSHTRRALRRGGREFEKRALDAAILNAERGLERAGYDAAAEARACRDRNLDAVRRWIGPWVGVLATVLVVSVVVLVRTRPDRDTPVLDLATRVGLVLVILAYATELLFFQYVIRRYQMFGEYEVMRLLLGVSPQNTGFFRFDGE